jgi:uncharacterized protein YaaW (UPF0174 family)
MISIQLVDSLEASLETIPNAVIVFSLVLSFVVVFSFGVMAPRSRLRSKLKVVYFSLLQKRNELVAQINENKEALDREKRLLTGLQNWNAESLSPFRLLSKSKVSDRQDIAKLLRINDSSPAAIEKKIRSAGSHSIASFVRWIGKKEPHVPYKTVVFDVAKKVGASIDNESDVAQIEKSIFEKTVKNMAENMSQEEKDEFIRKLNEFAEQHGKKSTGLVSAGATITIAQASGFGVYLLASSVVGSLSSAAGVALSFGAYTGMSEAISFAIGPAGWVAFGLAFLNKLASPNYKKTVPAVIYICGIRPRIEEGRNEDIDETKKRIAFLERRLLHDAFSVKNLENEARVVFTNIESTYLWK